MAIISATKRRLKKLNRAQLITSHKEKILYLFYQKEMSINSISFNLDINEDDVKYVTDLYDGFGKLKYSSSEQCKNEINDGSEQELIDNIQKGYIKSNSYKDLYKDFIPEKMEIIFKSKI